MPHSILARRLITLFSTLLLATEGVHAQSQALEIQIPTNISQCVPAAVNWTGGVPPYTLIATPRPASPGDTPEAYRNITGNSYLWTPKFHTETLVFLAVSDSANHIAFAGGVIEGGSNNQSCLGNQATTTSSTSEATSSAEVGDTADSPSADTIPQGLSGGAIAGIVVGGLAAAALFAFLVTRIRRKRVQAFRKRHRATRSDWQVLGDMPYKGEYAFSSGDAQVKSHADMPAPPSPAMKRSGDVDGGVAARRTTAGHSAGEPPTSPF